MASAARTSGTVGERTGAGAPPSSRFATGPVLGVAAATVALLLAVAARNGYHRDELYFLAASHHLALGYVDQPPIAVLVAWLDRVALGNSLFGLRTIPALVDGAIVALTAAMARELGGERFAQVFAAVCVAFGGFLIAAHLEGPTIYDGLDWALTCWLVLRILRTGNDRLWLLVGLTVGVGLEAKETVLLLLGALALGLLVNRQATVFRSSWLWAGALLALAIWAPNLIWDAIHGWPTRQMDASLRAEHSSRGDVIKFPFLTVLAFGPLIAVVWLAGWWALLRRAAFRPYRAFSIAFALLTVFLWIYIPGRFYYFLGLYPLLFAAGAVVTQDVVDGRGGFFRRVQRHRWLWRSKPVATGIALLSGLLLLPISLPVLPPSGIAALQLQNLNYNLGEELGWPDLTREVAVVWDSIPPAGRRSAVIVTANYGEAGAIDRYGPSDGLPSVFSGHNSFWWWGPPPVSASTAVAVGFDRRALTPYFRHVVLAGTVHNPWGDRNQENGQPIWLATGQRQPWPVIWPQFKSYG